jgi:hypothetical protein
VTGCHASFSEVTLASYVEQSVIRFSSEPSSVCQTVSGVSFTSDGRTNRVSPKKMRSYNTQELSRANDLDALPELGEVPLVAGNQVGLASVATL